MSAPNIVNTTSIIGHTALFASIASGSDTTLLTGPTNHIYKIDSVIASNKTGSSVWITLFVTRSAADYILAYRIIIPTGSSLTLITKDAGIYLEEGDVLKASSGTSSSVDLAVAYEDIS